MKTQIGLYVDVSTADELRERARRAGCTIGELADLTLRFALARLSDEALAKWSATLESHRGRLGGGLTKGERQVAGAFDRLRAREPEAWRFGIRSIASEAGMRLTDAFWALKALQARGFVFGAEVDQVDRWGRPLNSIWHRASDRPAVSEVQTGG